MSSSSPQDDQTKHRSVAELSIVACRSPSKQISLVLSSAALPLVDASVHVSDGICTVGRPVAELIGLAAPSSYSVPGSISLAPSLESFWDGGELGTSLVLPCRAAQTSFRVSWIPPEIRSGRAG